MFKLLSGDLVPLGDLPRGSVVLDPDTEEKVDLANTIPERVYYVVVNHRYLPDWVTVGLLDWVVVSGLPEAIRLIEAYPRRIFWEFLSANPAAMGLLEKNLHRVHPLRVSENPAAIDFLHQHPEMVEASGLCRNRNPRAVELYPLVELDWRMVSHNCSNIEFLLRNLDKLDWKWLSRNPVAAPIALLYPDCLDWNEVSMNQGMMPVIERYPERVNRLLLLRNPNAVGLIEGFLDELLATVPEPYSVWIRLSMNPSAVGLMRSRKEYIVWEYMCRHPEAIDLVEEHFQPQIENNEYFPEIRALSANPKALHILEAYSDVVNYRELAGNKGIYL